MKNLSKLVITIAILLCTAPLIYSQPGSTGGFGDEPEDAPLDGGIIILVAAGAAYGYKKLKK
jgi:hypothetical protein